MYWHFIKLNETETIIEYAFGFESKETSGRLEYNKIDKKTTILQHSENSDYFSFNNTIYNLIEVYGAPDKRVIAYGWYIRGNLLWKN